MWERRSHVLELLDNSTFRKIKLKLIDVKQKAFEEIRWILSHKNL